MSGDDDGHMVGPQLMERSVDQCRNIVCEYAVAQKRGIWKLIEKLLYIESDDGIAVRGEPLGELLMRLPKPQIVAEEKHSGLWMPLYSRGGIEVQRLALQLPVTR